MHLRSEPGLNSGNELLRGRVLIGVTRILKANRIRRVGGAEKDTESLVPGFVFGAVKAWTAYVIASNEIASRHRIDLDATIFAMAQTAKDMNSKYKETSEAGLALSVTLC